MSFEFHMSCSCSRPRFIIQSDDEPQLTKKLLTLLGYRHVKLVASQKHRFAGALIASKHPFTISPASPVELGRVIAVRVEG